MCSNFNVKYRLPTFSIANQTNFNWIGKQMKIKILDYNIVCIEESIRSNSEASHPLLQLWICWFSLSNLCSYANDCVFVPFPFLAMNKLGLWRDVCEWFACIANLFIFDGHHKPKRRLADICSFYSCLRLVFLVLILFGQCLCEPMWSDRHRTLDLATFC